MPSLSDIAKKKKPAAGSRKPATKTTSRKPVTSTRKHATKTTFPVDKVATMWDEGKSIEDIAKATGYYRKDSPDPTSGFRARLNLLRSNGTLKIGFRAKGAGKRKAKAA
jgi:hypothetical protein